jgi:hypothetical protein
VSREGLMMMMIRKWMLLLLSVGLVVGLAVPPRASAASRVRGAR